jgi:hypothetical protein
MDVNRARAAHFAYHVPDPTEKAISVEFGNGDAVLRHYSVGVVWGGRAKLSGVAEVFNVYNHANYGRYNGLVTSPTHGQPLQSTTTAHLPRIWQLGFRVGF